ncbi:MAG TPA: MarP family serine protease [Thermoleophilaceae bacterium]|nr:MarP family serine protease [Thermoleophilaceae bacterium]
MTAIDWIIVGFTLAMALWGYAQGLIVGALSLAGFAVGAVLGARVAPLLLEEGSKSPYAPVFSLVCAAVIGGVLASGLEVLGFHLRRRFGSRLGALDGAGGSVLLACLALGLAWVAGAVALQTPGARELREEVQRSEILRRLNSVLPPSGPILNALARFDPLPQISGPAPRVRPPTAAIARDPEVQSAAASVARVLGTACGLGVQGSGWVAGDGVVVTNAHVVAGQDDTTVQIRGEGARHDADVVFFDVTNDVAVLRSSGIAGAPALAMDEGAKAGTSAAILGFPENGPYDVQPGRLGLTTTASTQDAYGRGPVRRRITTLRGLVRHGNSGGPMVDGDGQVVTTVFASSESGGAADGFGVPDSIVREALGRAQGPVDTGPCVR